MKIRQFAKFIIKGLVWDFIWDLYGPWVWRQQSPCNLGTILFVCKGNICRSAFAHYLASRRFAKDFGAGVINVMSSGLEVRQSEPSPQHAVSVAKDFGVDLEGHSSQQITLEQCQVSDLILAMEGWQWRELRRRFPSCKNRIFLLSQFAPKGDFGIKGYNKYNITDPYGKGDGDFRICFQRIECCLDGIVSLEHDI